MNQTTKTVVILGAAAVLAVLASMSGPRPVTQDLYSDQGELFFPAFDDPAEAVKLEVTEFNEDRASARKFAVERDSEGRWVIPSHFNYPADAKERMAKAAAMLIGLVKSKAESDRKEDHVMFGVVDPLDESADPAGRGTEIKMEDSAGNVLADLIIGKEVDGKLDHYYVREPGKRRTYSVKIEGELSTNFADWIETDLLKAQSWDMQKIIFDNYSVDEQRGQVVPGEKYEIEKDDKGQWTVVGLDAEKEKPNTTKLNEIATTLTGIKIVGVRRKPEGLTARLEKATGVESLLLSQSLRDKGFFLGRGGKLYSNEGDLLFETKKGVRYTLRFGELVPGGGEAVSSGIGKSKEPEAGKDGPEPMPADHRYLMVSAEFDQGLLERPEGVRLPEEHMEKRRKAREDMEKIIAAIDAYKAKNGALPESLAKLLEKPAEGEAFLGELPKDPWGNDYVYQVDGEAFVLTSLAEGGRAGGEGPEVDIVNTAFQYEDDLRKTQGEWDAYDKRVEEGRDEADRLTKRFGPWYYVIDKTLFDKLKPKRSDLVEPKEAEKNGEEKKDPGK